MAFGLTIISSFFTYLTSPPKHVDPSSRPPYDHLSDSNRDALHVTIPLPNMTCTIGTAGVSPSRRRKRDVIPLEMWSRTEGDGTGDVGVVMRITRVESTSSSLESSVSEESEDST